MVLADYELGDAILKFGELLDLALDALDRRVNVFKLAGKGGIAFLKRQAEIGHTHARKGTGGRW